MPKLCSVDDCDRKHAARGMCHLHWARDQKSKRPPCSIEGCGKPVGGREWCNAHYLRWRKHGDPLAGNPSPRAPRAQDNPDGTRTCLDCGEAKQLDQFPRDANASRGRRSNCKPCHTARAKDWYAENKADHLPRVKARYQRDIERMRARDAERYERDKPKRIALVVEAGHRRRALLRGADAERGITVTALRKRHGDACCYCKQTMTFARGNGRAFVPTKATIEHVVPLALGGHHTWANTTLACWQCNVRKNATPLDEWLGSDVTDDDDAA